jgi:hypothetical protein
MIFAALLFVMTLKIYILSSGFLQAPRHFSMTKYLIVGYIENQIDNPTFLPYNISCAP